MKQFLIITFAFLLGSQSYATDLHMARSSASFPETMLKLQETIKNTGYTVSRVQRVDIGLTASGYKTDKYRVVFYGKAHEVNELTHKYAFLNAYLPLKIAIFAEGEETLMVASSPLLLDDVSAPELKPFLVQWEKDLVSIMSKMRVSSDQD